MDSFENNSYGQGRGNMSQSNDFGTYGSSNSMDRNSRENGDSYTSRRDDYSDNNQSSGEYESGLGRRREHNSEGLPSASMSNGNFSSSRNHDDSYGTGMSGDHDGLDTGSRRGNNEYGSGHSDYRTTSSSAYSGQKESFGDKMIDKAAEYAKKQW